MTIKDIFYNGQAIGTSLVLSMPEISLLQSYQVNFDMAVKKDVEMRASEHYEHVFTPIFSGFENNSALPLDSYLNGLREGIKVGLRKKGIMEDDRHLQILDKNQNIRRLFKYVNDFICNSKKSEFSSPVNFSDHAIILANLTLIIRLTKLRNPEYMQKRIEFFIDRLKNNPELRKRIEMILKEVFSDYVDYCEFRTGSIVQIPDEIFNPPKNTFISSPLPIDQSVDNKFWKPGNERNI